MEIVIIIMHCTFLLAGPIGPPGLLASENEVARTQIRVAPGHRAMCYVEPCGGRTETLIVLSTSPTVLGPVSRSPCALLKLDFLSLAD